MKNILIVCVSLLFLAACSGTPGNPTAKVGGGTTPNVAVPPKFDAAGKWKVISQNCADITFADGTFTVTGTKETVQNWVSDDPFDSLPGAVVGILDVQSGDLMFCYNGTIDKCTGPCQGMLDANNKVEMTCYDNVVPPPTCTLVLQKAQ